MPATMTITFEGDHIRVESQGDKSIEWARELWTAIVAACEANDCTRSSVLPSR